MPLGFFPARNSALHKWNLYLPPPTDLSYSKKA
jgi:hypothetical protein